MSAPRWVHPVLYQVCLLPKGWEVCLGESPYGGDSCSNAVKASSSTHSRQPDSRSQAGQAMQASLASKRRCVTDQSGGDMAEACVWERMSVDKPDPLLGA